MQDTAAKFDGRRTFSDSEPDLPGLYDQLVYLKDWKEETAELCSAIEARYAVCTDSLASYFYLLLRPQIKGPTLLLIVQLHAGTFQAAQQLA